jgi:hypothetical protein
VSLCRDLPFAAFYFSSYELYKYILRIVRTFRANRFGSATLEGVDDNSSDRGLKQKRLMTTNSLHHFIAGGLAGASATTLTMPMDVIKSRVQTGEYMDNRYRYFGLRRSFVVIWNEEGMRGLTRGLSMRLMQIVPSAAITFTLYEIMKNLVLIGMFPHRQHTTRRQGRKHAQQLSLRSSASPPPPLSTTSLCSPLSIRHELR